MASIKTVPIATKTVTSCLIGSRSITSFTKDKRILNIQKQCQNGRSLTSLPMAKREENNAASILGNARYGGKYTVTMMPGDGIGPEMTGHVRDVFRKVGAPINFEIVELDPTTDNYDDLNNAISSGKRNGCAIKGN